MKKELVFGNPALYNNTPMHYCPGCHYGIFQRIFFEALDETGIVGESIVVCGIGCSMVVPLFGLKIDGMAALHGRAPSVATGIKRAHFNERIVFTIQGDGDLTAIGMGEIMNAAIRFEKLTTIFLNNTNFGTTGGQMAPTTIVGQKTSTTPEGRRPEHMGYPVHMAELMAEMKGVCFSYRGSLHKPANVTRTKKAIKKAIRKQIDGVGYGFVEILSACPPGLHVSPPEGLRHVEEVMVKEFPLGIIKDVDEVV